MFRSGILFHNLQKMSFFRGKSGKNREIFQIFNFCLYKSIDNVKIHFLSKFRWKILIFEEVMSFFIFTNLQGHWPGFTKIVVGTFQKKPVTLEVIELEPSNFAILCLIWCNQKSQIIEAFEKYFRCVKLNMPRVVQNWTAPQDRVKIM